MILLEKLQPFGLTFFIEYQYKNRRKTSAVLGSLLVLQQVPDLGQQDFLSGGGGGSRRLSGLLGLLLLGQVCQLVQTSYQEEHYQSQNQEVDNGRDEVAVVQRIGNGRPVWRWAWWSLRRAWVRAKAP